MAAKARGVNVGRSVETGAILGILSLVLAGTGLLLSPTVTAVTRLSVMDAGGGNVVYAIHLASAALLVAFTLWHLWPLAHAFARKAGVALASQSASYVLLGLVALEIGTGLALWLHDYRLVPKATAVKLHLYATFVLLAPLAWHAWRGARVGLSRRAARLAALAAAEAKGKREQALAAHAKVARRTFLRLGAYAVAGVALAAAFGRAVTGQLAAWRLNYVGETPLIPKDAYRLKVTGLVAAPVELTFDELVALGPVTRRFTHRCVEGWTYTDSFTGVPLSAVLAKAGGVAPGARQVILKSAETSTTPSTAGQRYTTNFPVDDALSEDALVVFGVGDPTEDLPALHGGPVRVMSPAKWGYKACKWLNEVEVTDDAGYRGYWERLGYHNDGDYPGPIFA